MKVWECLIKDCISQTCFFENYGKICMHNYLNFNSYTYMPFCEGNFVDCFFSSLRVKCLSLMLKLVDRDLGPVAQSIVNLTMSLRRQLVKYMPTELSNTLFFLLEKCENLFTAKDSHIFPTKNNSVFVIFTFENLTKL